MKFTPTTQEEKEAIERLREAVALLPAGLHIDIDLDGDAEVCDGESLLVWKRQEPGRMALAAVIYLRSIDT